MAGLCAAARARELGADVVVLEKGDRPGGSMLLSSGFVWRHTNPLESSIEPPGRSPFSSTTTSAPSSRARAAAHSPAIPAPATTRSGN